VALDLLSVYPEDSGVYTCHARNAYGEAVSSATIKIFGESAARLKSPTHHPTPPTPFFKASVRIVRLVSE
jgi:titin